MAITVPLSYDWAGPNKYGALALVIGAARYLTKTQLAYVPEVRPPPFNTAITAATTDFQRDKKQAEHEERKEQYAILEGAVTGISENIRDALDTMYHEQLEDETIGYTTVEIKDYFDHLTSQWCKLTTTMRAKMKEEFYEEWGTEEHITALVKRLTRKQKELLDIGIVIQDQDKIDHFIKQMYDSRMFDKKEMNEWEKKPDADKTFANAKIYFQALVSDLEVYEDNNGGNAKRARFESAANMEEEKAGDGLRQYIETLAKEKETSNEHMAAMSGANTTMLALVTKLNAQLAAKDDHIAGLAKQIEAMLHKIQALTDKVGSSGGGGSNSGGGGGGGSDNRTRNSKRSNDGKHMKAKACSDERPEWLKRTSNKGGYCWTHGFNPNGKVHDSKSCKNKADGHKDGATKTDRQDGSVANKPDELVL